MNNITQIILMHVGKIKVVINMHDLFNRYTYTYIYRARVCV